MKLTIFGNNGPYPAPGGACSGYLIRGDRDDSTLLVDCGTGVLARLMETETLDALDAVVLTHLHYDHMSDMLPLQYALQFRPRKAPLPVYAPDAPEAVRRLLEAPCFELRCPEDFRCGSLEVGFAPARHPVPTNAVSIREDRRRLVFTGDSNTCEAVEALCLGADLLLADCGLSERDHTERSPHYSAALCGALARKARAGRLLLTHLNPKYDPEVLLSEARSVYPEAELARLGETYRV